MRWADSPTVAAVVVVMAAAVEAAGVIPLTKALQAC